MTPKKMDVPSNDAGEVVEDALKKVPADPFENLVAIINKSFGANAIYNPKLTNNISAVDRISTGNLQLDFDLGGGFVIGKNHLVTGQFSSGKTYLTNKIAAEFTRRKQRVGLIDSEFTFDKDWTEKCGVDLDYLSVIPKGEQEEVIDIIELMAASGQFGAIILDSIAALIPKDIRDDEAAKNHMGKEARLHGKMYKKLMAQQADLARAGKLVPTFFAINQWRKNLGYGAPNVLPGGAAQHFFSSTWIDFWVKEPMLDAKDKVVGMYFTYKVLKNKTAPARRTADVSMFVDEYKGMTRGNWDHLGAIMDVAVATGVIQKSGKWYSSPLLTKQYMYSQLWNAIYNDLSLERKILDAVQMSIPEIKISYIPALRAGRAPELSDAEVEKLSAEAEKKSGKKDGDAEVVK